MAKKTKILKVLWASGMKGNYGIVLTDNGAIKKVLIGSQAGVSPEADIEEIIRTGAKLSIDSLRDLLKLAGNETN